LPVFLPPCGDSGASSLDDSGRRDRHGHETHDQGFCSLRLADDDPRRRPVDRARLCSTQVSSLEAEVARLTAEAQGKPFAYAGSDPNWVLQAAIFGHRRAEFESRVENYRDRLEEYEASIGRANSDAAGYRERLGFGQDVEQMRKTLEDRQAGSRLNTLLASDVRAEMARALANAEQSANESKLDFAALGAERDAFVRD
jgi:hemolysin D